MANYEPSAEADLSDPNGVSNNPPLKSMAELFYWYQKNLCRPRIFDVRGHRVRFLDTDFVHLIKLVNKYGDEPKNRTMTFSQIRCGRVQLREGRFSQDRARALAWARSIIEDPAMIVENWQPLGRANPGEAYIKDFEVRGRSGFGVLVCGFAGKVRRPVTMFRRERFGSRELSNVLWRKSEEAARGGLL